VEIELASECWRAINHGYLHHRNQSNLSAQDALESNLIAVVSHVNRSCIVLLEHHGDYDKSDNVLHKLK